MNINDAMHNSWRILDTSHTDSHYKMYQSVGLRWRKQFMASKSYSKPIAKSKISPSGRAMSVNAWNDRAAVPSSSGSLRPEERQPRPLEPRCGNMVRRQIWSHGIPLEVPLEHHWNISGTSLEFCKAPRRWANWRAACNSPIATGVATGSWYGIARMFGHMSMICNWAKFY